MHVFFSAGEPSGDEHAAHLIEALKVRLPGLKVSGLGGPKMEAAGSQTIYPLTTLAVMGIFAVFPLLWKFFEAYRLAKAHMKANRPDLVVLVDFPGFNWWIAAAAKREGIPVVYFMPPQLWAWGPWRIRKVRKTVSHVLSGLQFETEWYARRGIPVTNVGHPFFDEMAHKKLDEQFIQEWRSASGPVIAILPGSRRSEVEKCWPLLAEAMVRIHRAHPNVTFLVANYREGQRQFCTAHLALSAIRVPVSLFTGKTSEIIAMADFALMVSGSVCLELLGRGTPPITLYRCSWLTCRLAKLVVTIKYMSLLNLMRGREAFPEYLSVANPEPGIRFLTESANSWLANPGELERVRADLLDLRKEVYSTGAIERAADFLTLELSKSPPATWSKAA